MKFKDANTVLSKIVVELYQTLGLCHCDHCKKHLLLTVFLAASLCIIQEVLCVSICFFEDMVALYC